MRLETIKRLKFRSSMVPGILDGSKTCTWRMFDEKDLQAGDEIVYVEKETGREFARGSLVSVKDSSLAKLKPEDYEGQSEGDWSNTELLSDFQQTYGEDVTLDTPLKIVRFRITKEIND